MTYTHNTFMPAARTTMTHLWHGFAHDLLVVILVDLVLGVVRLQRLFHLLHDALLSVQLLQVLQEHTYIQRVHSIRTAYLFSEALHEHVGTTRPHNIVKL